MTMTKMTADQRLRKTELQRSRRATVRQAIRQSHQPTLELKSPPQPISPVVPVAPVVAPKPPRSVRLGEEAAAYLRSPKLTRWTDVQAEGVVGLARRAAHAANAERGGSLW